MTTLTTMTKTKMMIMRMMMMMMMMMMMTTTTTMTMTTTTATHNMSSTWIIFTHNVLFGCRFAGSVSSPNLCSPTWLAEHPTLPSDAERMYGSQ
jgi:hypothetical protein